MQWVELIGPHGIGKTTLRRCLRPFCPQRAVGRQEMNSRVAVLNYYKPTQWGAPEHWGPFMECVERLITNNKVAHWERRRKFCKSMLRMISIDQDTRDTRDVWDLLGCEGMRLSFMLRDLNNIRAYFETMPLSLGVVVLHADKNTIVQRNRARSKADLGAWAARGLASCALAADILSTRTRVLRLDATQSVEVNAQAIVDFAGLVRKEPT